MKKIMSFLAVAVLAVTVFISTKNVDQADRVDLASLTTVNTANAECQYWGIIDGVCIFDTCWWNHDPETQPSVCDVTAW